MEESKIKEAIASILDMDLDLLNPEQLEIIEEAIEVSNGNVKTSAGNRDVNFDKMWKDVRAIFHLTDKVGVGVAKNVETLNTLKVTLVAAALEIRRQVKSNQRDLAALKRDFEREAKEIKKSQEDLLNEIKSFKKMVDLYMNPPSQMGPLSRKTLKPYKGVEKD